MKYKLPKPEDYPEIKDYAFKLSKAYATLYGDAIMMLINIRLGLDALNTNDEFDREWAIKNMQKLIDKYEIEEL